MENKQSTKKQTLIHIALVVGGFVAGSVIWGNGSNIMNSNDSANESVKKQQIELANSINALAQTANQVNKPAGLVLTEQDKELIGKTAAQYLIEHPENLVEAGKRLEANRDGEKTSDVVNTKDVLLETKFTPNYGPDNADVAVIEFFDYMCHFCQQSSPVLEKAIAENKNVRTFFKDFT
ncbi:TPA: DsbA family protein, partial [Escherichia coli]